MLGSYDQATEKTTDFQTFPLSEPLREGQDYELELRVQGQTLTARFNGQILGTATDASFDAGRFGVGTVEVKPEPVLVKSLEILDLAASPSASVAPGTFPPGQWVKMVTKFEDLPGGLRLPGQSVQWDNGWIRFGGIKRWVSLPKTLTGDYGVRLRFLRHDNHDEHALIALRIQENLKSNYGLKVGMSVLAGFRTDGADPVPAKLFDIPWQSIPKKGEEGILEFYVVGTRLIDRTGAALVGTATDDHYAHGWGQVVGSEDLRDIEVVNLDGLPLAEALKLAGVDEQGRNIRPAAVATPTASAEGWQPVFTDTEWRATTGNHEFKDGLVRVRGYFTKALPARDGTLRVRVRLEKGGELPGLIARNLGEEGHYKFTVAPDLKSVALYSFNRGTKETANIGKAGVSKLIPSPSTVMMELRVQGDRITGLINGDVAIEQNDGRLAGSGAWGIEAPRQDLWVESVEFQPLSAAAAK